jgi:hypothetical protein
MTSNYERARWAEECIRTFAEATGVDTIQDAIADLIGDLGHYADELELDFIGIVAVGIGHWHLELDDESSIDPLPCVDIRIGGQRKLVS